MSVATLARGYATGMDSAAEGVDAIGERVDGFPNSGSGDAAELLLGLIGVEGVRSLNERGQFTLHVVVDGGDRGARGFHVGSVLTVRRTSVKALLGPQSPGAAFPYPPHQAAPTVAVQAPRPDLLDDGGGISTPERAAS